MPPAWARLEPNERNTTYGKNYLKLIGLDSNEWLADLVAFWKNNPDLDIVIKRANVDLRSSETRGIISFEHEGKTYNIVECGFIQKQFEYAMFRSLKDPAATICDQPYYPIQAPNTSVSPIKTRIECRSPKGELFSPEPRFFDLANVYCFDLDQTLTIRHITGFRRDKLNDLFDLLVNPSKVRSMFEELLKRGKHVYIVSFTDSIMYSEKNLGGVELVSTILQMLLPEDWNKIKIIAWYPALYGKPLTKNGHLKIAADEANVAVDQVILVDDDAHNIYIASLDGYQTLHVPRGLFAQS